MSIVMDASRLAMHNKRKRRNVMALTLSMLAMGFGLFWLAWILFETVHQGIGGLGLATFIEMTPTQGSEGGGLANAIAGSALMVAGATAIGTPNFFTFSMWRPRLASSPTRSRRLVSPGRSAGASDGMSRRFDDSAAFMRPPRPPPSSTIFHGMFTT